MGHVAGASDRVGCTAERRIDNLETLMTVTLWAIINIVFFLALTLGLSFIFINAFKNADRRREERIVEAALKSAPTPA